MTALAARGSRRVLPRTLTATTSGRAGLAICAVLLCAVIVGPALRGDPDRIQIEHKLERPSLAQPLGTDSYGRDQLARVLAGGRRSVGAAVVVLAAVASISLALGTAAALAGGLVDAVLMRLVDVVLGIPSTVFALALVGILGPGFGNLVIALTLAYLAYYTRLARGIALSARSRPDVIAARLAGVRYPRVVLSHVIPRVLAQLGVIATLDVGTVIVSIAGFSFLGLGIQPPTPEWGSMLADARGDFAVAPWLLITPTLAIVVTVAAASLVGDALRDSRVS